MFAKPMRLELPPLRILRRLERVLCRIPERRFGKAFERINLDFIKREFPDRLARRI